MISPFVRNCNFSWKMSLSNFAIILQAAAGGDEEFFKLEEYGESFIHHEQGVACLYFISVSYIACAILVFFAATLAN